MNYYNEIDPFAAAWLRELMKAGAIAEGEVDERDIRKVQAKDLKGFNQCHFFAGIGVWSYAARAAGWPDDTPVWTGSCPCQSFSASGKRGGFSDQRHLWPAWFRLIRELRPQHVFGEQVAGKDGAAWLDIVSADLEGVGYTFGAADIPACGFGAPHKRNRLYFVAESMRPERRTVNKYREDGCHGKNAGWPQTHNSFGTYGEVCGMANSAKGRRRRTGGTLRSKRSGGLGELGNPAEPGFQVGPDSPEGIRLVGKERQALRNSGITNGYWSDAEWLFCRDQKYRAVEPGTFPLAHGSANRVGRLRGYGNALCAPAAQAFIEAYLETRCQPSAFSRQQARPAES